MTDRLTAAEISVVVAPIAAGPFRDRVLAALAAPPPDAAPAERHLTTMWGELPLEQKARLMAKGLGLDPSANAFEHAATMVEALPSSAVSGNCQECGFPLVCVACEAREDARPEWQYGALPTHGQVLAAIASTHPTTEETLVSNFSPPTERPSAWMSLDWRERLRHIVAVVEELRAAGLITVAVDTSTRGRLRLLAPAALETRDRGGQTGCGGTPDAGLVALVREWQEARNPAKLTEPGVGLAETYQAAVKRMTAADEALAAYDLNGPAGGALVGQTAPTESTGVSLRDELAEIIRWRFKSADGKPLDGAGTLKHAQEIADAIVPVIEEAVSER